MAGRQREDLTADVPGRRSGLTLLQLSTNQWVTVRNTVAYGIAWWGEPDADDRFVRLDDGDMHVVENGKPGAPALLLIYGSAGSLALIDMGPTPDAKIPESRPTRLLLAQFPGPLLWRLKTEATIRKAIRTGFTRPVDIPDALIEGLLGMTYRAFAGAMPPGLPQAP